jgi:hypothetical protein
MALPHSFRSFAEFEREIIRPNYKIGLSVEDMIEDTTFEEELDFEADFDSMKSKDDDY